MDFAQLEYVEAVAWTDLLCAVPSELRARRGIASVLDEDGGLLSVAFDGLLFNRVLAIGTQRSATAACIRERLAHFRDRGIDRYLVHVCPWAQPAALREQLEDQGLTRYPRSWAKFARGPEPPPEAATDLRIAPATADDAAALSQIFVHGFGLPEVAAPFFASLVGRPRWHTLLAYDGDRPAAAATLFVHDGVGYLAGAATLPAFRCRGAQAALMATRIELALDLGCHSLSTETGEAVRGDPQHSYRNMRKAGFHVAYVRENFAPPGVRFK